MCSLSDLSRMEVLMFVMHTTVLQTVLCCILAIMQYFVHCADSSFKNNAQCHLKKVL